MNWFKKSLPENHVNPRSQEQKHRRVKKTTNLKKSQSLPPLPSTEFESYPGSKLLRLASCPYIEIIDPELFFHDPDHVRNYREEAKFLQIMSEWEIIESPSTQRDNYFSADFDDDDVLQKEQQQQQQQQQQPQQETEPEPESKHQQEQMPEQTSTEVDSTTQAANTQSVTNDNEMKMKLKSSAATKANNNRKRCYRRSFTELIFADKIEIGLLPSMYTIHMPTSAEVKATPPPSNNNSPVLLKKRRRLKSPAKDENGVSAILQENLINPPTCSVGIIKDCAINRSQLKTEALAGSIMGAIGKCPAKDKTPAASLKDLIRQTGDLCHPINSCDHYDIKKFFRLDDNGNILLNMSHIEEIKGFGYASAENKKLYKQYLVEVFMADENIFCTRRCCLKMLQRMLVLLWNNIKCKFSNIKQNL